MSEQEWRIVSARPSISVQSLTIFELESTAHGKACAHIVGAGSLYVDYVDADGFEATKACLLWLENELKGSVV